MALLLSSVTPFPSSTTFNVSSSSEVPATPFSRFHLKPTSLLPKSFKGMRIQRPFIINSKTGAVIVKASSNIDGTGPAPVEGGVVPVDKLPLESKTQEKLDQKLRMKLAKKIRLRRARLVRKRKLRKKGRWPPSKMKKLKNV